jgi:putative FmdB family regulatory protein
MPYYDYKCSSCEHVFEENMKIVDRNKPTEKPCPSCSKTSVSHVFGKSHIGDPWHHAGRRIDDGFRDRLREIKKLNPRNTIDIR